MEIKKKKLRLDIAILIACCFWIVTVWFLRLPGWVCQISLIFSLIIGLSGFIDIIIELRKWQFSQISAHQPVNVFGVHKLILLNDQGNPIKEWDMTEKTAMVIGRKSEDEEVDVDLNECEYSGLINVQHAVLNYCLDAWYIEDLDSKNGIKIQKAQDRNCYQAASDGPLKITTGDVIYIAKAKLLVT